MYIYIIKLYQDEYSLKVLFEVFMQCDAPGWIGWADAGDSDTDKYVSESQLWVRVGCHNPPCSPGSMPIVITKFSVRKNLRINICWILNAILFLLHSEKWYCMRWSRVQYHFSECNKNDTVQRKMWYLLCYIPFVLSLMAVCQNRLSPISDFENFKKLWFLFKSWNILKISKNYEYWKIWKNSIFFFNLENLGKCRKFRIFLKSIENLEKF